MKRKTKIALCAVAVTAATVFTAIACDMRLLNVFYNLKSSKVKDDIKIAFISDLHDSLYGKKQSQLIGEVDKQKPDIVVFGGDLADKTMDHMPENSFIAVRELVKRYPCYFSMGNHEYSRGDSLKIKKILSDMGVKVLEGNGEVITVKNSQIEICGIFDAFAYDEVDGELVNQLEAVTAPEDSTRYRVLIAHFPEDIEEYLKGNFDLILSGHAHGGQWIIPGVVNGVYAPGQGFFPKYAGGLYTHGKTFHVVSRGLWKPSTLLFVPRVFNRPELVFVNISPDK